jgi:predicted acylesterase/phospholipase RssA
MTQSTTLVLGGGGVWGVAWMTGLIAGLAEAGVDVRKADCAIGTSAGSVVAALARMMAGAGQVIPLDQEIAELRGSGSKVTLVSADPDSLKVAALGPLNPATRTPGANAGRAQGLRVAHEVREAF